MNSIVFNVYAYLLRSEDYQRLQALYNKIIIINFLKLNSYKHLIV